MSRENFMSMTDFNDLVSAKQFAFRLMEEGIQFSFCPFPLSISYPLKAIDQHLEEQPISDFTG